MQHLPVAIRYMFLMWALCRISLAAAQETWGVALDILTTGAGDTFQHVPLASGIPLARGVVFDPGKLQVFDRHGKVTTTQAHQLGMGWPDGSLRWVFVQFFGSTSPVAYRLALQKPSTQPLKSGTWSMSSLIVEKQPQGVMVSTGRLKAVIFSDGPPLPSQIWLSDAQHSTGAPVQMLKKPPRIILQASREYMSNEEFVASGRSADDLVDFGLMDRGVKKWGKVSSVSDYTAFFSGPLDIQVEEQGPVRAVLRISPQRSAQEGAVGYVVRLYFYADKAYFRTELSVINYELKILASKLSSSGYPIGIANAKHIHDFHITFFPDIGEHRGTKIGTTSTPIVIPAGRFAEARQRKFAADPGDNVTITNGKTSTVWGPAVRNNRLPGWMSVQGTAHSVTMATKYFWETFPKGLRYDPATGECALLLRPSGEPSKPASAAYSLAAGRGKTYEFVFGFDVDPLLLSLVAREDARPWVSTQYVNSTQVRDPILPVSSTNFPALGKYITNSYNYLIASRLWGDLDFGDIVGWTADARFNNYHDISHEWFHYFISTKNLNHYKMAEAFNLHVMDVDTTQWDQPRPGHRSMAGGRESEFARFDHVSPYFQQGGIKQFIKGSVDHYFLTGKRRVLEFLRQTMIYTLETNRFHGKDNMVPDRHTSIPLFNAAYVYQAIGSEQAVNSVAPDTYRVVSPYRVDAAPLALAKTWVMQMRDMMHFLGSTMVELQWQGNGHTQTGYSRHALLWSYLVEGFYRYYRLTGAPEAKSYLLDATDRMFTLLFHLPTGSVSSAQPPNWQPWDMSKPWADRVDGAGAQAYLVSGDKRYLEYILPALDYRLNVLKASYAQGGLGSTIPTSLALLETLGLTEKAFLARPVLMDPNGVQICLDTVRGNLSKDVTTSAARDKNVAFADLGLDCSRLLMNFRRFDEAEAWLRELDRLTEPGLLRKKVYFVNRLNELKGKKE